jgi:hypothetical protein
MAGIVLLYTAVVLTIGGTPAARPLFYGLSAGWIGWLSLYTWRRLSSTRLPSTTSSFFELVGTNAAFMLFLGEAALRIFGAWSGNPLILSAAMDGYRLIPGQDYGAGLRGNRLGYPGREFQVEKASGVMRIAALGDSFAIGPAVPFADNYLTLLERPGVEVYNFGISGAGPREYLTILRRDVWRFQPDLVLLSVFVGNDITESLATPRHLDPGQHALYLLVQRSWRIFTGRGQTSVTAGARCAGHSLSPQAFREVEARRLAVCRHAVPNGLEKKWQQALAYLADLVTECRSHGVPLAVVLIPDEFQVNPAVLRNALADAGLGDSTIDLNLPQRRLAEFFRARAVPCLDLLPAFGRALDLYAPCDTHWNIRGNHRAADQVSGWLYNMVRVP